MKCVDHPGCLHKRGTQLVGKDAFVPHLIYVAPLGDS